jgi:chaperone required for assembly of F1-ATPase
VTGWKPRRFWTAAGVAPAAAGWTVQLDGRPVRTPAKAPLIVPTERLAAAIAAEWDAQGAEVRPADMPLTRAANAAIDRLPVHRAAVVAEIAGYGASDLLCYRAEAPAALAARQAAAWDPLLAFAADTLGAPMTVTRGVIPVEQPAGSLARLRAHVAALDDWALIALSDLVALSGSLVIGLAVVHGRDPAALWPLSRIDEDWQAELWGTDPEAAAAAGARAAAFHAAARFLALSRPA